MSWNNVKQLPWFSLSRFLSPSLWFPRAPLKCSHAVAVAVVFWQRAPGAPAHLSRRPKTMLVQTERQTRDDTAKMCFLRATRPGATLINHCTKDQRSDDTAKCSWRTRSVLGGFMPRKFNYLIKRLESRHTKKGQNL